MKRIGFTVGDPAGIGPDILIDVLASPLAKSLRVFSSRQLIEARAATLGRSIDLSAIDWHEIPLNETIQPGQPSHSSTEFIMQSLDTCTDACLAQTCAGMVTGPINKSLLNQAGIAFSGHTEYLAARAASTEVVMSFFAPQLILGLYSTHLPLSAVPAALTAETLRLRLQLFARALKAYLNRLPRIGVLGLNPHAGEQGFLGTEEIDIIEPVLAALGTSEAIFEGPLSADSTFSPRVRQHYDALFAMYHDQGLCGLKALDFGDSVNVTLGLPFIRTSVDHGTAYAIAGQGKADARSALKALEVALQLTELSS